MATSSSNNKGPLADDDARVLNCIERHGLGLRELLRLGYGKDPNNVLGRLLAKRLVTAVRGALPNNRAYYLPRSQAPYQGQALRSRLAVLWHVFHPPPGVMRVCLAPGELAQVLGPQAPPGVHVLEREGGRCAVRRIYAPQSLDIVSGVRRHLDSARTFPLVNAAIREGHYAFTVLVPWSYQRVDDLKRTLSGQQVRGLPCLAEPCGAAFLVERVPGPESLTEALKQ